MTLHFLPTQLQDDIILGLPWLKKYNPKVDWTSNQLTLNRTTKATDLARALIKLPTLPIPQIYSRYARIFDESKATRFPPSRPYDHAINLKPDFIPKRFKPYSLPVHHQKALNDFIEENLKSGYIRPSKSPMASPIFFVDKKDGGLRPCQDYRYLNNGTIKNGYPLPRISDLLDKLTNAKWFCKLDIRWGYNNIRIKDGDQWKAAFVTPSGLYEPTVMFFGLCNSPATFQAFMNDILHDPITRNLCLCYMDDVLTHAPTLLELIK